MIARPSLHETVPTQRENSVDLLREAEEDAEGDHHQGDVRRLAGLGRVNEREERAGGQTLATRRLLRGHDVLPRGLGTRQQLRLEVEEVPHVGHLAVNFQLKEIHFFQYKKINFIF